MAEIDTLETVCQKLMDGRATLVKDRDAEKDRAVKAEAALAAMQAVKDSDDKRIADLTAKVQAEVDAEDGDGSTGSSSSTASSSSSSNASSFGSSSPSASMGVTLAPGFSASSAP